MKGNEEINFVQLLSIIENELSSLLIYKKYYLNKWIISPLCYFNDDS